MPLVVRPFDRATDLDPAARLLADRHRRHRLAEPALDASFGDPGVTRAAIEEALGARAASGHAAVRDGAVVGYLVGMQKDPATWGENVWVEAAGHAAVDGAVLRALYAAAAAGWVAAGRNNHHVLVPATDTELVEAWFGLDFGQQHLHAVREAPGASFGVVPQGQVVVRRASRDDTEALLVMERVLPDHLALSPVFSRLQPWPIEESRRELEEDLGGTRFTYWLAEHEGRAIGSAIGCSLEESPGHQGPNRPPSAAFLAYAAVLPEARGLGAGRALGDTVLAWARDAGFRLVATDWRSTNIEADRAWRSMGFRPTFRRLHRSIL